MSASTYKYASFFHELFDHLGHTIALSPEIDKDNGEVYSITVLCAECEQNIVTYDNDGDLPTHLSTTTSL